MPWIAGGKLVARAMRCQPTVRYVRYVTPHRRGRPLRITDVSAVYPKWKRLPVGVWQSHFWQIVVRVEADNGVVGYGYGGGGDPACLVVNQHFRELVIGSEIESVDDIRALWDRVYALSLPYGRKGLPVMALSGLDLALWDMLGKSQGRPVYDLLGGLRKPKVRGYATGKELERYRDMGYTAAKFPPGQSASEADLRYTADNARQARTLFGDDALIMTDCYMAWDFETTKLMADALREFDLYWFEDVMTPDHLEEQAALREIVHPINVAGGEHEFTRFGFAQIAKAGALDIWQPDVAWCGGITETLRILNLASQYDVPVVPHRGGEIWGMHVIAATDCVNLAETHPERWEESADELWIDEPRVVDGYLTPLDRPGFGVILNEAML